MRALRRLDEYFIGAGEGTAGDYAWFYGQYVVYVGIVGFTLLSVY